MGCLIKGLFIMGRDGSRINTQCKIEGAITLYANQRSAGVREANQKLNLNSACSLPRLFVISTVETAENWVVEPASDTPFILTRFGQTTFWRKKNYSMMSYSRRLIHINIIFSRKSSSADCSLLLLPMIHFVKQSLTATNIYLALFLYAKSTKGFSAKCQKNCLGTCAA